MVLPLHATQLPLYQSTDNGVSDSVVFDNHPSLDLVLVLVFWTKMLISFSHILVTSICDSFSRRKLKKV